MYNEYFGFKEAPFSIAPDPRYLYMTAQHRDALAHLVYGLNSEGGCILLTGEVGTGKTTICRCLLEQIPEQANVALVMNPKLNEIELLETICDELKIAYPDADNSVKTYTDRIYEFLIKSNRDNEKTVLIIDEAQNLPVEFFRDFPAFLNFAFDSRDLMSVWLVGHPSLTVMLDRLPYAALASRIQVRVQLDPIVERERFEALITHALQAAGCSHSLLSDSGMELLRQASQGLPRYAGRLLKAAMQLAVPKGLNHLPDELLQQAMEELR